jgi:Ser/Thr protein kinase RdoA (MazF antagonist)
MTGHDLSTGGDVLDRVTRFAERAAQAYGCAPSSTVQLLNISENATYLIEDPGQGPSILRVHRLGYHTEAEIES